MDENVTLIRGEEVKTITEIADRLAMLSKNKSAYYEVIGRLRERHMKLIYNNPKNLERTTEIEQEIKETEIELKKNGDLVKNLQNEEQALYWVFGVKYNRVW